VLPRSVCGLRDDKGDVLLEAQGPSWKPSNGLDTTVLAPASFTEEQALAGLRLPTDQAVNQGMVLLLGLRKQ
jgi:hypothetical protein